MSYESEHYNLESIPNGWSSEEFRFVVRALESLDRQTLSGLLAKFEIHYTSGKEGDLDDEELIAVLIDDVPKDELLKALRPRE